MNKLMILLLCMGAAFTGSGLKAESSNAIYLLAGLDGKMLTNQDANNYYNLNGQLGPRGYSSGVLHLGFQFKRWMALEASANFGLNREYDVTYENGLLGATRRVTSKWSTTTYSIMPAITWANADYVNVLGVRAGLANLTGHIDDSTYGFSGSYDQEAKTYDVGVLFRTSWIAVGHVSLGLELGYDWTMFRDIKNKNGSGTYETPRPTENNISTFAHNGDPTVLDFSGAHVAIVLGLWSNPPVSRENSNVAPINKATVPPTIAEPASQDPFPSSEQPK
jgi:hypothetical protein